MISQLPISSTKALFLTCYWKSGINA